MHVRVSPSSCQLELRACGNDWDFAGQPKAGTAVLEYSALRGTWQAWVLMSSVLT